MNFGTVVPHYVELRYPDGKLAARFDPVRGLLELQKGNVKHLFDLALLAEQPIDLRAKLCYNADSSSFGDELKSQLSG